MFVTQAKQKEEEEAARMVPVVANMVLHNFLRHIVGKGKAEG